MDDYGILSLVPALLTIAVAFYSKNVLLALVSGIISGSLILASFNPFNAMQIAIENQVLKEVVNGTQIQVVLVIFIIGGFVKLLEVSGGAGAFARKASSIVTSRSKAQVIVWLSGLGIFFTDSGNSLIIGPLYRSVFDEFKLCREKLAYILDTTSSPISILIPFISWGAYIMSLIDKSYAEIGLSENSFTVLIKVIPYQFYAFLALATVPIIIFMRKDYGPMKVAQARYLAKIAADDGPPIKEIPQESPIEDEAEITDDRIGIFLYPLGVMLFLIGGLITWHATHDGISTVHIRSTMVIAYLSASLTCAEMMRRYRSMSYAESLGVFIKGAESMVYISIVLVLAWSLSSVNADVHTADYIASLIGDSLSPMYFPMIVFVLGAIISLSTGSSYGTFAILMSIAIPVGFDLGASMYLTIAAVLSGGLFGDHVSPISDTTVLASVGAECAHLDHVTTQAAYAGVTGLVALIAYGLAGAYETPMVLPVALVMLFMMMYFLMRVFGGPDKSI
ncbi:MAG: sodium:proton exchanger [SAR86 cluster bacterium]|uniref:Sodium:proton exchanger n=1 Tax=SAR86 cluster bacterium TaxID=2030880 RepID=A0A2A4WYW8_9GAMM|nr:MAG: sodium:proton exchanger [SAR86 cluster bacterium]